MRQMMVCRRPATLLLAALLTVPCAGLRAAPRADTAFFVHPLLEAEDAPLVALHRDGTLHYALYRDRGSADARNIVPDFSRAGYHGGGVALPARAALPVRIVLHPAAGGDDHARIQQAIDTVSARTPDARGVRGVVLLARGRYTVSQSLRIASSGVVLRGEGRGAEGTVIRSTTSARLGRIIEVGEREPSRLLNTAGVPLTGIASERVPVGALRVALDAATGLRVGEPIVLRRTPNAA
ncbi:MAG: hypothetical protein GAK31_00364 [Stenotrophomonas maltophilia]|uniref:Pectate lyase n=1 Tax=Stenotrophomonas maltophilia TaxID=40324 RepID=A0A7V8FJ62_STEMA|nr:MAG: hypothetical protein GAK31_00364 [Stenotrophomonas maltophilia]